MATFNDNVQTKDGLKITHSRKDKAPKREKYTVVNGLFKNGKLYKKGSTVELDGRTAENFKKSGDIK